MLVAGTTTGREKSGHRFESPWADPRLRHKNHAAEFATAPYEVVDAEDDRNMAALHAVREFMERHGRPPTQETWTAARMTPSERTIRRPFGSFAAAVGAPASPQGD